MSIPDSLTNRAEDPADQNSFRMGFAPETITPELQSFLNSDRGQYRVNQMRGVIVLSVFRNRAAARAGLRPGDVITQVNGYPVATASDVGSAIGNNSTVRLQILRDNLRQEIVISAR